MKTCFKCETEKPLSEFYRHPSMADGCLNKCKACTRKDVSDRTASLSSNPEWALLERMRHRLKSAKARLEGTASKLTLEQQRKVREDYARRYPEKRKAHNIVAHAIRAGTLERQPCEQCGKLKVQAHHDDYLKPLDVRWLCVKHHNEWHVQERERELVAKLTAA